MKAPEEMATDVKMMQEMLCDCETELNKIHAEMDEYISSNPFPDNSEYFLKKVVELKWGEDKNKCNDAIKRLSVLIAKERDIINTDSWDAKYEHAVENVDIEDVIRHYMKVDGDMMRRRLHCPFHDGKSNHLQVYKKTNSFHCFSCKASGTPISFVMKIENCTFKEAVEIMQNF